MTPTNEELIDEVSRLKKLINDSKKIYQWKTTLTSSNDYMTRYELGTDYFIVAKERVRFYAYYNDQELDCCLTLGQAMDLCESNAREDGIIRIIDEIARPKEI